MKLKRTSSPLVEPITLQQAKDHLKVSSTGEDSVITFEITSARKFIEREMGVQMISCGYEGYLDCFPDLKYIEFPIMPLTGVTTVEYYATDGTSYTTLSASAYILDDVHKPPRLHLQSGYSWPGTKDRVNAVKITFNAGYNTAAAVPEQWVQAVKMMVTHLHEHRGDEGVVTIPKPIYDLIHPDSLLTV